MTSHRSESTMKTVTIVLWIRRITSTFYLKMIKYMARECHKVQGSIYVYFNELIFSAEHKLHGQRNEQNYGVQMLLFCTENMR